MQSSNQERYQRQIILKGFGEVAQNKLAAAKVLVVGAGGLGCPALQYLVAAGVGCIGIVDDDIVTLSNLHRQVLYTTHDVGMLKAKVSARRLSENNPEVSIDAYAIRLQKENIIDLIRNYDLVIDGTDNFATRYLINDACALLSIPVVYGAVAEFEGQVAIFNKADENLLTTNYRDLFKDALEDTEVLSCNRDGVLGVLPGIIGTMQAAEAIKLITGVGRPLVNRLMTYNILSNQFTELIVTSSHAGLVSKTGAELFEKYNPLPCNKTNHPVAEINADALRKLLKEPGVIIIDVREKNELPHLDKTITRIPMSVLNASELNIKEDNIVFICSHGVRSFHAANRMHTHFGSGKKLYSLKGGLTRHADELNFLFKKD